MRKIAEGGHFGNSSHFVMETLM